MKKIEKVAGFVIEAFPKLRGSEMEWFIYFVDQPSVNATGASFAEAKKQLEMYWQKVTEAFIDAGLPVPEPEPVRQSGFDLLLKLAEREWKPIL